MSADMFVGRFITELKALPPFKTEGTYNAAVHRAQVPAWRATFTAAVLARHVAGYRLPTFDQFKRSYMLNLKEHAKFEEKFKHLTTNGQRDPKPDFLHRLYGWYETGMTEVYVYVTLAHVLEDILQEAVVMYDARVDWKGKCDLVVLRQGEARMVDTHYLGNLTREQTEAARDERERIAKEHTNQSAHWKNAEYKRLKESAFTVVRDANDCEMVNGISLFSPEAMNKLLREVYDWCDTPNEKRVSIEALRRTRPGQDVYQVQQGLRGRGQAIFR